MLPIDIDMKKFVVAGKKEAAKLEKNDKKKRTNCSQQAMANNLVLSSMANNPNTEQVQQAPAQQ